MSLTWNAVRDRLEQACKAAGSQQAFAVRAGVSQQFVCQVLSGARAPSARILAALGLERVVVIRRKRNSN